MRTLQVETFYPSETQGEYLALGAFGGLVSGFLVGLIVGHFLLGALIGAVLGAAPATMLYRHRLAMIAIANDRE